MMICPHPEIYDLGECCGKCPELLADMEDERIAEALAKATCNADGTFAQDLKRELAAVGLKIVPADTISDDKVKQEVAIRRLRAKWDFEYNPVQPDTIPEEDWVDNAINAVDMGIQKRLEREKTDTISVPADVEQQFNVWWKKYGRRFTSSHYQAKQAFYGGCLAARTIEGGA